MKANTMIRNTRAIATTLSLALALQGSCLLAEESMKITSPVNEGSGRFVAGEPIAVWGWVDYGFYYASNVHYVEIFGWNQDGTINSTMNATEDFGFFWMSFEGSVTAGWVTPPGGSHTSPNDFKIQAEAKNAEGRTLAYDAVTVTTVAVP
jgi:hypothetical protein